MPRYRNLSGESGVVAYEIGEGAITVAFRGGERYLYTARSAGAENIAKMQELARAGRGLATFVSQHVKDRRASWTSRVAGKARRPCACRIRRRRRSAGRRRDSSSRLP